MATKLLLIRHGETAWNAKRRYCGNNDVALSKKGKLQAEKLRDKLKNEIIHKVFVSDRKRAIQTAKILFNGSKEIKIIPNLKEIHFGCFEGLTHKEILKKYNRIYQNWLNDPYKHHVPRGEKLSDFKKRVVYAIKRIILQNPGTTIAAVCHGGVISVFVTHILRKKDFWKHIPRSASLTMVEYKNKKPKITLFNDISYLIPPSAGCR